MLSHLAVQEGPVLALLGSAFRSGSLVFWLLAEEANEDAFILLLALIQFSQNDRLIGVAATGMFEI